MTTLWLLFLYIILILNNAKSSAEIIEWDEKVMFGKCAKVLRGATETDDSLRCYWTFKNLIIQKLEVISRSPFIIQYHNMVHRRLCKRAVNEAEALRLEQLMIVGTSSRNAEVSQVRMANGTWLNHKERPEFHRIFNNLEHNIEALDLNTAEPWQILSYDKTGYYAPHYDYLSPETNQQLLEERGNRIATVLVILQIAKKGGTTVFPKLDINIRPKAGDVIVWINFETNGEADMQTLHAACPIHDGVKVGATLWVHAKKQELRLPCSVDQKLFDTKRFFG